MGGMMNGEEEITNEYKRLFGASTISAILKLLKDESALSMQAARVSRALLLLMSYPIQTAGPIL